jgi:hypothetical protein
MFDNQGDGPTAAELLFFEECRNGGLPDDPKLMPESARSMIRALSFLLAMAFGQFIVGNPTLLPYFTGADWDVEDVVREIEKAADVKWIGHLLGHDLAVLTAEGNVRCFQVTRDGGE